MRIAVVHNLPPGGQKRALYEQLNILCAHHTIDLFTLSCSDETFLPLASFVQHTHIEPFEYPAHFPSTLFAAYHDLPRAYKNLAKKINQGNYDCAYVQPCFLTQAPYILRYLTIPSLYYCPEPKREFYESIARHSNFWTYWATYPFRFPLKRIDWTNAQYATRIITNSIYSAGRIRQIYGREAHVNYLGVDGEHFSPRNLKQEHVVLTVGDLSLHKGHDFIIKSLSLIDETVRPKLVIIGYGGTEESYLINLARKEHVDLTIQKNISDEKLRQWYNRATIFAYAAIAEPFGMVLLEALSSGLFAVAVDEAGVREIITSPLLGVLVKRDIATFARVISSTLQSAKLSERKRRNILIQKNWNWEKSVRQLEKELHNLTP